MTNVTEVTFLDQVRNRLVSKLENQLPVSHLAPYLTVGLSLSNVANSDICTCRPYLTHAIEECIKTAQRGGCGVVIYYRKEGRSLGEVTKYLVYNTRKRQVGGDSAAQYFNCTEQVAGVQGTYLVQVTW